ncbi:MAG TPA: tetratricopeptide repeat protein, partial [Kofleriaceae bacterium]|nr:tetratricopeptide repeat protein [Kofleriaceae bacterium]
GPLDLAPALIAVTKLGQLAEAAAAAKDLDRAADLRARGDQLIAGFAENAQQDPQLALALGMAYLQSGDAAKAEPWLRRGADARPTDAFARYQLAKALGRLERYDDAIEALQQAGKLDERHGEIGLELARTYEASGRDADAGALYERLLAGPDPSLELRARAGRFFARRGEYAKAAAQGEKIYAAEPAHPAGLYLKAEGALAAGKPEEAAKLFRGAVDADRDPQYLDGQGRAAEALSAQTGEAKLQDVALRAYMAAAELAPTMFNPHVGLGRLYLARREAAKAIPPLLEASKLRPDDPEVTRLIGLAYKELQERHVAIEWLARAYRLAPAAETAWHLGQLYGEVNATRDAIAAYGNATRLGLAAEQAGAKLPWLTEALYKLGRIYMDSGNEQAAKAAWVKFVRRNPKPGAQLDEVRRELETTLQRY